MTPVYAAAFVSLLLTPAALTAAPSHEKHSHEEHSHEKHEHPAEHRQHAAHVHGEGRMTLAMQANTLEIMLEAPADSLFGFEQAPTTPAEHAHVAKVLAQLKDTAALFALSAGECQSTDVHVNAPFPSTPGVPAAKTTPGHADVEASYVFTCQHPARLTTVTLPLFTAFPPLHTLTVEYVTDHVQGMQTLTPAQPTLRLE